MSKDNKFLNQVKLFSENFDHKYEIEEFHLNESYSTSLLIKVTVGGSSGGDCWGGSTSNYRESDYEIIESLVSTIRYKIMDYFTDYVMVMPEETIREHIKDYDVYSKLETISDGYDYYGNHTEYGLYEVSIFPLMKKMLDDNHFQIFKSYVSNEKEKVDQNFETNKVKKTISELKDKIEKFETEKIKEKRKLTQNISHYENALIECNRALNNFETNKEKEFNILKEKLEKLI